MTSNYVDLIYLTCAMVLFSMVTINFARHYNATSQSFYRTEIEFRALSVAQDEIDAIRWVPEDELDPDDYDYLYKSGPIVRTITYEAGSQYTEQYTLKRSSTQIENSASQNRYRIRIVVETDIVSPFLSDTLEYIKAYTK